MSGVEQQLTRLTMPFTGIRLMYRQRSLIQAFITSSAPLEKAQHLWVRQRDEMFRLTIDTPD
ncbi:hypothetical protein D0864_05259 [Hortaea werneckii]|uniref:Uncharacterized protein n=1 Tax=Hortaea werneckii TaxID=91943 RepID=A0A3M7G407_HORWE|nr:hypothetical protein D0864_05259 [Hortaea werneckii]